jgi:hypothetical protein
MQFGEAAGFPATGDKPAEDITILLERLEDVFPSELPYTLPPERGFPHRIETTIGATPPARPPIRLSTPRTPENVELRHGPLLPYPQEQPYWRV